MVSPLSDEETPCDRTVRSPLSDGKMPNTCNIHSQIIDGKTPDYPYHDISSPRHNTGHAATEPNTFYAHNTFIGTAKTQLQRN